MADPTTTTRILNTRHQRGPRPLRRVIVTDPVEYLDEILNIIYVQLRALFEMFEYYTTQSSAMELGVKLIRNTRRYGHYI